MYLREISLLSILSFISLWSDKIHSYFSSSEFVKFVSHDVGCWVECVLFSVWVEYSVENSKCMISFSSDVFMFIFCPDVLSDGESGVWKSRIIIELVVTGVVNSNNRLLMKLSTPEFGTYMFRVVMSSLLIVLLTLDQSEISLSPISFSLKSYFVRY